jgi:hypothetical protein
MPRHLPTPGPEAFLVLFSRFQMNLNTFFGGDLCTKDLLAIVENLLAFQKNVIILDLDDQFQGHMIQDGHHEQKIYVFS